MYRPSATEQLHDLSPRDDRLNALFPTEANKKNGVKLLIVRRARKPLSFRKGPQSIAQCHVLVLPAAYKGLEAIRGMLVFELDYFEPLHHCVKLHAQGIILVDRTLHLKELEAYF